MRLLVCLERLSLAEGTHAAPVAAPITSLNVRTLRELGGYDAYNRTGAFPY